MAKGNINEASQVEGTPSIYLVDIGILLGESIGDIIELVVG